MTTWDGDDYQRRFDDLAASGVDVHGEATFVRAFAPSSVLDAGCGTGRVAIELARHGVDVVGADLDASMLATAALSVSSKQNTAGSSPLDSTVLMTKSAKPSSPMDWPEKLMANTSGASTSTPTKCRAACDSGS